MASVTLSMTFWVDVASSHLSWSIVDLLWTRTPLTLTSKLPVWPSSLVARTDAPGHSDRIVASSALAYFVYPHPPQYWMVTMALPTKSAAFIRRRASRTLDLGACAGLAKRRRRPKDDPWDGRRHKDAF